MKVALFIFSVTKNKNVWRVPYLQLHRDHLNTAPQSQNILETNYSLKVCSTKKSSIYFKQLRRKKIWQIVQADTK